MFKKKAQRKTEVKAVERIVEIDARMEGNLNFNTPINLKINGNFEGELEAKGNLIIGEKAIVKTKSIKGENIIISGKVSGNIISSKRLELLSSAKVIGDIKAPVLVINEGASLKGRCQVPTEAEKSESKKEA